MAANNNNNNLRQQLATLRRSLLDEGFLDRFFIRVEQIQDEDANPQFVENTIRTYIADTTIKITQLGQELITAPINLREISRLISVVKGSSSCFGARRVARELERMMREFNANDIGRLMDAYLLLKDEFDALMARLMPYTEMLRMLREAAVAPNAAISVNNGDAESVGSNDPIDD